MSEHVFRIDSFAVPDEALDTFRRNADKTLSLLRQQPGFVRDQVFERVSGPGRFNIVTVVEWMNAEAQAPAAAQVQALHRALGFDGQAFTQQHGIDESKASYVARSV